MTGAYYICGQTHHLQVPVEDAKEDPVVSELARRFPQAPRAELLRFCRARKGSLEDASKMYEAHLQWREGPGARQQLLQASQAVSPKYIRCEGVAKDGNPLILVQGARYEQEADPMTYVLACAQLLDRVVPPTDSRKITVLVDVRPGEGWPNVAATQMLPFFKLACQGLPDNFPERVSRVVIYPMPWIVQALWRVVAGFLDPVTRAKFVIISGDAKKHAPCPQELNEYFTIDQLPADARDMHAALKPPMSS